MSEKKEYIWREDALNAFATPSRDDAISGYIESGDSELKAEYYADVLIALSKVSKETINAIPAADVVEVVHAHWKPYDACDPDENAYECSACGFVLQLMDGTPESNQYNGCPHCLARMDGDAHD